MPIRPDWLAGTDEAVAEPELPLIDSHHHLWDRPGAPYLFADFLSDTTSGHNVVASVFVECHGMWRASGPEALRPVGETEFAAGMAAQSESGRYGDSRLCAAIVGFADLGLGSEIEPVLDAHIAASGGRFRGIRGRVSSHEDPSINQWQTPADVLREPAARSAIGAIVKRGLSLDIWAYQTQVEDVAEVCREFPDLTVIVDHAGGPLACGPYAGRRDDMFRPWVQGIELLAGMPNTVMKLSGLGMRFAGFEFHRRPKAPTSDEVTAAWRPYIDTCVSAFGPDRCMFGSNFPPDKAQCSYQVLWNSFKKMSEQYSDDERHALFCGTASRIYRIETGE